MPYKDLEIDKIFKKNWYLRNRERLRKEHKLRYASDSQYADSCKRRAKTRRNLKTDEIRRWRKLYCESRRQWLVQKQKLWRKNNPEKAKAIISVCNALRRGREKNASGVCSSEKFLSRVEFYGWRCAYCKIMLTAASLTADHRIPLSKGGTNWPSNLVPACRSCNCSKSDKILEHL